MNAVLDPDVQRVVWMKSTQFGYSDAILNNIIGYFIDVRPRPMLLVLPVDDDAKGYSKKKLEPMFNHSGDLRNKIRKASRARRHGETLKLKEFDGGFLRLTGANSGSGLRSDPIPVLLLDEVDAYPDDVDGEGDPVDIADRRTDTYDDAIRVLGSTPAKPKGMSRIEAEWLASDQRRYHVPCPFCGFKQALYWCRLVPGKTPADPMVEEYGLEFERDDSGLLIPGSARYRCAKCKRLIEEKHKAKMLAAGGWVPKFPERRAIRGYHISALYSPWKLIWNQLAEEWLKAQNNPEKLKAFFNLRLGETYEQVAGSVESENLEARREKYSHEVPAGVAVLVASADVQHNRIEVQITGFGAGEEQWLIQHATFFGDPSAPVDPETGIDVWKAVDDFLLQPWQHARGFQLKPAIAVIDSSDQSAAVYSFVGPRQGRRVFALKGVDNFQEPGLVKKSQAKKGHIWLWIVKTFAAKERIFARLKIRPRNPGDPVAGLNHFPSSIEPEYFRQLTGERLITVRDKRTRAKRYEWRKIHHSNEALDLTVYAHAGLEILTKHIDFATYGDLDALAAKIAAGYTPDRFTPIQGWKVLDQGVS